MAHSVQGARSANRSSHGRLANLESMLELGVKGEPDANDQHIVGVVDWLLQYAFEQRASDIHMEPRRDVGLVRLRIDGVLHKVYELPAAVAAAVTSRFKILARLDVAEKRRPQDGRLENPNAGWCGGGTAIIDPANGVWRKIGYADFRSRGVAQIIRSAWITG